MGKEVKIIPTSLEVEILGTTKNISTKSLVVLKEGQHLKILKKLNSDKKSLDDLLVVKDGEDLIISYIDGQSLIIENFYSLKDIVVELPVAEYETHLLSSNDTGDSFSIIYSQGDITLFESMFEGNQIALNKISEYSSQNELTGINSGDEVKTENSSVIEGVSDTTLIVGGVVGVGAIAAAAGGGGSGGGGSGGGSSSSSSPSSAVQSQAQLVDSPIYGVDVYKEGALLGNTNHNGNFNYTGTTGDTFEFKIGQTSIGTINYEDIPADGIITIQDLVGVDRNDTANADVVAIAQFLQTLDADGDASNGIQILTNSDGDVVFDANIDDDGDGVVTAQEIAEAQTGLTGTEEVILDVSEGVTDTSIDSGTNLTTLIEAGDAVGGTSIPVNDTDAQTHLNSSLQQMYLDDGYTFVSNGTELTNAALDPNITKIVITNNINFLGKDTSVFTDVVINNFDNTTAFTITMSPEQISHFSASTSSDDGLTALVEAGDTDLTNYDLSGITGIHTNGQAVILTVAQTQGVSINNSGGGSFEVIDSISNLAGNINGLSSATNVTAVLPSDGSITDLSGITLDNDVTILDLNGQTNVLATFVQIGLITNGSSLVTNGTILVKDTAANIIAEGNIGSTNVIISDAVSISDLQTIQANTTGTVDASVAGVFDTAYNIWNDGGTTIMDVRFEIDGAATLAQLATIDSNKGNNGTLAYDLIEDSNSNLYNGAIANNIFITGDVDVTITGGAGIATITALDPLTTGIITGTITNVLQSDVTGFENINVNGNNEIAITLSAGYTTATASDMLTLISATSAPITATSLTSISGSGTDLINVGNASNFNASSSLRVIGTPNISVSDANMLDWLFTGPIVGTISEGDITTLVTLTDTNNNNELTINLTSSSATAYALQLVNDITSVEVNAQSVSTIFGSYSDLTGLNTSAGNNEIELASSLNLTVNFDTSLTVTQIDTLNTIATNVLNLGGITEISGDIADLINLDFEYDQGNVLLNSNVEITVNDDFNRAEFNTISNMTNADIVVGAGASLVEGTFTSIDLSNYSGLKNLTSLDVTANSHGDSTISLTATDIFAANDNTGDLTFAITGTNGAGDTVELSTAEGWTDQGGGTYTVTGNFDGVAGNETYTLNLTDVSVTMIA